MAETFGLTTKGGTENEETKDYIIGTAFTSGPEGTLVSISLYVKRRTLYNPTIKCAIYDASNNLLANGTTEEQGPIGDAQDGWIVFNFSMPPSVAATTLYRLCFWPSSAFYAYYNAGSSWQAKYKNLGYDGWPDPCAFSNYADREYSIYATYTEPNQAPTAPTSLEVDGKSAPTGANCISSENPQFSAIYNDPDAGDISNAIQIQVGTASGLSDMWDSGWLADSTVTPNRCTTKTYAGAALSAGTSYWWRCRFRDDGDLEGAWSAWQQFDICAVAPPVPPGIGLQCIHGGPLPHRRPFTCATRMPREEPGYRFPYQFPELDFPSC